MIELRCGREVDPDREFRHPEAPDPQQRPDLRRQFRVPRFDRTIEEVEHEHHGDETENREHSGDRQVGLVSPLIERGPDRVVRRIREHQPAHDRRAKREDRGERSDDSHAGRSRASAFSRFWVAMGRMLFTEDSERVTDLSAGLGSLDVAIPTGRC